MDFMYHKFMQKEMFNGVSENVHSKAEHMTDCLKL